MRRAAPPLNAQEVFAPSDALTHDQLKVHRPRTRLRDLAERSRLRDLDPINLKRRLAIVAAKRREACDFAHNRRRGNFRQRACAIDIDRRTLLVHRRQQSIDLQLKLRAKRLDLLNAFNLNARSHRVAAVPE